MPRSEGITTPRSHYKGAILFLSFRKCPDPRGLRHIPSPYRISKQLVSENAPIRGDYDISINTGHQFFLFVSENAPIRGDYDRKDQGLNWIKQLVSENAPIRGDYDLTLRRVSLGNPLVSENAPIRGDYD